MLHSMLYAVLKPACDGFEIVSWGMLHGWHVTWHKSSVRLLASLIHIRTYARSDIWWTKKRESIGIQHTLLYNTHWKFHTDSWKTNDMARPKEMAILYIYSTMSWICFGGGWKSSWNGDINGKSATAPSRLSNAREQQQHTWKDNFRIISEFFSHAFLIMNGIRHCALILMLNFFLSIFLM